MRAAAIAVLALFPSGAGLPLVEDRLIAEADGSVSRVACVEDRSVVLADGAFSPRCSLSWSGALVSFDAPAGSDVAAFVDAAGPAHLCFRASRDIAMDAPVVVKMLFDGTHLRATTDSQTARSCVQDIAQSGPSEATLLVHDATNTETRMLVVVRTP